MLDLVIFGATGDLARRKLFPALLKAQQRGGTLEDSARIYCVGRAGFDEPGFRAWVGAAMADAVSADAGARDAWPRLAQRLVYVDADVTAAGDAEALAQALPAAASRSRIYYLAVPSQLYGPISEALARTFPDIAGDRIVLEKPIGRDRPSAAAINDRIGRIFREDQTFRIDHYLGKETVQNLLALRFGNTVFESLWNRSAIDHVQITVAESLGIGNRGDYYDQTGALRDMVQNHLLQLVCLVAMETPLTIASDDVHDEKLKVLRALEPMHGDDVGRATVRGQHGEGAVDGTVVPCYRTDTGIESDTETYVALRIGIRNHRWAGVPFYLRTGKRLTEKRSEIVVVFNDVAHSIFRDHGAPLTANRLVVRLQPEEGVHLSLMTKDPSRETFGLRSLKLHLSFEEAFNMTYPDAYDRLLTDVTRGDRSLFTRRDEVDASWAWIDGILGSWRDTGQRSRPYVAGSWGPCEADVLMARDGRAWHDG